jgi:hypothetical protein
MAQYTKNLISDGFEIYWMKRIVERDRKPLSLWDRFTGCYFLLANVMGDSTYFSATQTRAEEHRTIWQAFLGGNLLPMRMYIENCEFNEKMSTSFEDALFGC